jgi:hypothetical protein
MMKPLSRRSKWIYGTHDLELVRGSYDILKMLEAIKPEVLVWKIGECDFYGPDFEYE